MFKRSFAVKITRSQSTPIKLILLRKKKFSETLKNLRPAQKGGVFPCSNTQISKSFLDLYSKIDDGVIVSEEDADNGLAGYDTPAEKEAF